MTLVKAFGAAVAATLLSSFGAQATVLDFSGVQGSHTGSVFVPGSSGGTGATINHSSGNGTILVGPGAANEIDGFCFISTAAFNCEADGELVFDNPVLNLTFDIDGAQPSDVVDISAFNGAAFLGLLTFTVDGSADFSGFGTLTRLFFDDNSTAAGLGYSTFSYDETSTVDPIPVPAALPLLAAGIAGFGIAGWRRRQA